MGEISASRYMVQATWDDVPHLSAEAKAELEASMLPHTRDARKKGVPSLGSGAIYPVAESDFVCDPFQIPAWWPRAYGLDVGWKRTAAAWLAHDRDQDITYIYAEHYRGQAEPSVHAAAIRARGAWIPGVVDPAARGRSQTDGQQLIATYIDQGLKLQPAINAVEAGLLDVLTRLSTGRLRVFRTCQNWLAEFRLYRRDEKGVIVKENDHLMDATRYGVVSGLPIAKTQPVTRDMAPAKPVSTRAGY